MDMFDLGLSLVCQPTPVDQLQPLAIAGVTVHQTPLPVLLQNKADQVQLRALRGELNAARAELHEAQEHLVQARTEEAKKRELVEQEEQEGDKRLSE